MYTIAEIEQTLYACPSQWKGRTDSGEDVFITYQGGYLSLSVGGETVVGMKIDEELNGYIELGEALSALKKYIMISHSF